MTSDPSCSPLHVQDGQTALYIACKEGHDQIVELLLRREADINHQERVRLLMLVCVLLHYYTLYRIFPSKWPRGLHSSSEKNRGSALAQRKCLVGSTIPCKLPPLTITALIM